MNKKLVSKEKTKCIDTKKPLEPVRFEIDPATGELIVSQGRQNDEAVKVLAGSNNQAVGWNILLKTVFAAIPKTRIPQMADAISSAFIEMKPKNPLEAMLISQMITCFQQGQHILYKVNESDNGLSPNALKTYHNLALRHMRTFAALMEAYNKNRSGGKQVMEIRHITVERGGQAIIGNVNKKGRGEDD